MTLVLYVLWVIILLVLVSLTSMKAVVIFHRIHENDLIQITLCLLFGLFKIRFKIPYMDIIFNRKMKPGIKVKEEINTKNRSLSKDRSIFGIGEIETAYKKLKDFKRLYEKTANYFFSKLRFDYIKWHTEIGLDDAALTGFTAGILWGIQSSILSVLSTKIHPDNTDISVTPRYDISIFEVDLHCIIRVKIANIIIAGIRIIFVYLLNALSNKKGGEFNDRTSYTGINENYNG